MVLCKYIKGRNGLLIKRLVLNMKLALFITLATALHAAASSFAQEITLKVTNVPLVQAMQSIKKQSGRPFFLYGQDLAHIQVTASITRLRLDEAMDELLKGKSVDWFLEDGTIIVRKAKKPIVQFDQPIFREFVTQERTIVGHVVDRSNNSLQGVTVTIKGASRTTVTDVFGNYSVSVSSDTNVLIFSAIGFETMEVPVGDRTSLNVTLVESISNLEEVIVVGYGTVQKRNLVGSVSTVDASKLQDMPVNNIGQKLQGQIAGAQIYHTSGAPGNNMAIRIRGAASINAGNNPLIVIDGFPTVTGLSSISPDEIASISVLKDASATSLYGSRAANGVVLITTKSAVAGQHNISFNTSVGLESVGNRGKPNLMSAREFAQFKKEFYEDAARYEGYTGGVPELYQHPEIYGDNQGTDWFDILLRTAPSQNYNLSVVSGKKDLKSSINLNYTRQEGVMLNSNFGRFSGRANNVYDVSDRFSIGLNIGFSHVNRHVLPKMEGPHQLIQAAYLMDPTIEYKNADGTYPISFSRPGMFANPNWYLVVRDRQSPSKSTNLLTNAFLEYEIIDGLKYKISANGDIGNGVSRYFEPSHVRGGLFSAPPQTPIGNYNTNNFLSWLVENTMTYQKTINEAHSFDGLLGYSVQKTTFESGSIDGTQYPDNEISWVNAANIRLGQAGTNDWSILSYIGRLNYSYKNRYLLSAAIRRDGSSKFGVNAKWGNFPSVALGWIASEEEFLNHVNQLDFLKIRMSYGKVGNNNIGDYTHLSTVSAANYALNDQVAAGRAKSSLGNSNLTWETTSQFDLGVEVGLFNNRLFATYDYYWKRTNGLLYAIDIPQQSGFSSISSNIGEFNFWGHEVELQSKNQFNALIWNASLNISFNRNLVKKLGTNDTPIGAYNLSWDPHRTQVGRPMGQFFGFIYDGVYMTQEEFDTQPKRAASMVGTVRFKDISGPDGVPDGQITPDDRTFIGDPNPDFIYGITNEFTYKNFDFSFVLAGSVGGDIVDESLSSTNDLAGIFNVTKDVAKRWRSIENPGDGRIPRTRTGTTKDFTDLSTWMVFDGSYLAAKNITFGYRIPLKKYIESVRLYGSIQNLFILTNYPGMNPEASRNGLNGLGAGWDFASYPISRVFSLGLSIKFI